MSYHVLVVEDDLVTRSKLSGYFQNEGYQVTEAESGAQMREALELNDIDLVLLDINLPGEDGLLLTRELRSQSEIGIILVTGRHRQYRQNRWPRNGRGRLCHKTC